MSRASSWFVDDGSTDDTSGAARAALAGANAQVVRHEENCGWRSDQDRCAAREHAVDHLHAADGQIEPKAIETLRAAARSGDVDVVFSTYADRDDGLSRKVLSFGVRALITLVHGVRLQSDGPYLFRRELFVPEQLPPDTFFLNFEFPIRVLAAGAHTRNVVINCRPRRAGFSKSTGLKRIVGVARDLVDLRVRRWLS